MIRKREPHVKPDWLKAEPTQAIERPECVESEITLAGLMLRQMPSVAAAQVEAELFWAKRVS